MYSKKILCCGILRHEVEHLLGEQNKDITYIDAALHIDLDKLARCVTKNLYGMTGSNISLITGNQCHPDLEHIATEHGGRVIQAKSCIEMLLGEKMAELDAEANTSYQWMA